MPTTDTAVIRNNGTGGIKDDDTMALFGPAPNT